MPKYLFSVGLIPVQEFISEARRSRDLRAGSAILSWLMSRMLLHLVDAKRAEVLIPHAGALDLFRGIEFSKTLSIVEYSLPNRASGFIESTDVDQVFNELWEECIQANWRALFQAFFEESDYPKRAMGNYRTSFVESFQKAARCPIDLIWVAQTSEAGRDQRWHLAMIDQFYDNVKRTRPIREWSGKVVGKCDQCGKREALGPDSDYDTWWNWHKALREEKWVKNGARLDPGERLCIVCFTKRFLGYAGDRAFPSTSEIAAASWVQQLKKSTDPELLTLFHRYRTFQEKADTGDAEIYYHKRSLEKRLAQEDDAQAREQLGGLRKARFELVQRIKGRPASNLKPEPSNYLAVLTFDGDSMGKMMKLHFDKKLPELLLEFAGKVRGNLMPTTTGHIAEIFYLGGDEGLILVPIEAAIKVALDVNKLFHETVNQTAGIDTTLSMGLTVFDRERPLGGAIRLAHEALKNKAKKLEGKNSLSITIQTASGNEFSTTASWRGDFWKRVDNAIKLINGEIPDVRLAMGWTYEVEAFLQTLPHDRWGNADFSHAVRDEVKRITLRKLRINSRESVKERRQKKVDTWENLLAGDTWFGLDVKYQDVRTFSNALHAIAFLCRESGYLNEDNVESTVGEQ